MILPISLALLLVSPVRGSPTLQSRQSITTLTTAQVAAFHPYAFYASTAYCQPSTTLTWTCGANCNANPSFEPIASGGDGNDIQFWYVGYDPTLETVIVSHQGTDASQIEADLTDANFFLESLDSTLFPGVSSSVEVHDGFKNEQAKTATTILSAVNTAISQFGASKVAVVGHSLGAALALIDGVYLPLHLPSNIAVSVFGFGMPRVGNQAFANYVDAHLPNAVSRVNNREDVVPILPGRFLGFHHPSGEKHILDSGSWVACPGQDNTNSECTTGDVSNIFVGSISDHTGPYTGTGVVSMAC